MTTWQRDPRVLWRRSLDRVVLLAPDRDDAILLEGVARVIWDRLAVAADEQELADELASAFGRPGHDVDLEVVGFLAELRSAGALVST